MRVCSCSNTWGWCRCGIRGTETRGVLGLADQLVWLKWQSPGSVKKNCPKKIRWIDRGHLDVVLWLMCAQAWASVQPHTHAHAHTMHVLYVKQQAPSLRSFFYFPTSLMHQVTWCLSLYRSASSRSVLVTLKGVLSFLKLSNIPLRRKYFYLITIAGQLGSFHCLVVENSASVWLCRWVLNSLS